jgi:hypothetical protein
MLRHLYLASAMVTMIPVAPAQNICEGNGLGNAYLTTTPAIIGGQLRITLGSPTAPNGLGVLSISGGYGPIVHPHPLIGPVCLDITSGAYAVLLAFLDAAGDSQIVLNLPGDPATFGYSPLFANGLTLENNIFSISKTVRVQWEFSNSYRELPAMDEIRAMHSATAFEAGPRDNRTGVLVAGGGQGNLISPVPSALTQVFDSLTRSWRTGPTMALPRAAHRAVRLLDGRILITGGMVPAAAPSLGGPATANCEIYDPATNALSPTGAMLAGRMGHALSLLADGRVLASGGFADWTDAGPNFVARLGTVQNTTEIWNPATGTWSAGPTMASVRAGHSQTALPDGRLLVAGGVNGGTNLPNPLGGLLQVPTFTADCELFDPATNTFAPTAPLVLPRGFHGASLLTGGRVLVTGGAANIGAYGEAAATNSCAVWQAGIWAATAILPTGVAFHTQVVHPRTGAALIHGGFVGNFQNLQGTTTAVLHDGATVTTLATIGSNPGVAQTAQETGTHAACVMHDGTVLLTGGYSLFSLAGNGGTARAFLYVLQ